jgi:uncharacterized membrane protein
VKRVLAKFKQQTSVIRLVAVTSFALIYLAVWLKINDLQLESFSIYYYNLGINLSAFIQMAHTSSIRALFIEVDPQHPIYFLFMWIFYFSHSPYTLMVFSDTAMSLTIIPLYYIAREFSGSDIASSLVIAAYVMFFSFQLTLWEGFGMDMEFFPIFYLTAVYFYIKQRKISGIFFVLASVTNIVGSFCVAFFFVCEVCTKVVRGRKTGEAEFKLAWMLIVLLLSLIPLYDLLVQQHLGGLLTAEGFVGRTEGSIFSVYIRNFMNGIDGNLLVFLLIIMPFVPYFSHPTKYYLPILPYMLFYFVVPAGQNVFYSQYFNGSYFVPIMFVGVASSLAFLKQDNQVIKSTSRIMKTKAMRIGAVFRDARIRPLLVTLLIVLLIGAFYAPYGPLVSPHTLGNSEGLGPYIDTKAAISPSPQALVADFFPALVPLNATILIQDDLTPFSGHYRNFIFGPGNVPWLQSNYTYPSEGPTPKSKIPDFIAVDLAGWYYNSFMANTSMGSMSTWFPYFTEHYHYGLLAASGPFYLYKLNYTGNPIVIFSENYNVSLSGPQISANGVSEYYNSSPMYLVPGGYYFILKDDGATNSSILGSSIITLTGPNGVLKASSGTELKCVVTVPGIYQFSADIPSNSSLLLTLNYYMAYK